MVIKKIEERMNLSLGSYSKELSTVRTGRANPKMLDGVRVEVYGQKMPISQLATVSIPEPQMINVQVWDKANVSAVDQAIRTSDLNLNPLVDGQLLRIAIPKLTEERRKELIKVLKTIAEKAKVAIRNIRRDLVTGKAKIVKTRELKVAALLIVEETPYNTINQNIFLRIASSIRTSFRELIPANEAGALIPGIVLGDISLQSDWQTFEMRNTGLSHLTAVSGTNFAMIAGFIIWLIGFIRLPITARYLIVSSVLIFYIFIVRPSPSVLRAAIMTGVYLFASLIGEKSKSLAALGLAISALIIFDPFQANDPGFTLSVCATLGLITLAPILNEKLAYLVRSKLLAQSLSIPISATFFTLPVIVVLSNKFSPFSVIANLLTAVVIAPITVLGFMAAILAAQFPAISSFIIWLISPLSSWIVVVANKFSKFPALEFENSKLAIAIFIAITALAFTHYYRQMLAIFVVIAAMTVQDRISWPGNNWQIVSCDVGQGDATLIALPKHENVS